MERKRYFMSADEKVYLTELMHKYKDTLESKKTDCVNVAEKKKAWCALSKEFNSLSENSNQTPEKLKKCWENMKARRKKELAQEKRQLMATGGGPYKSVTEDNNIDDILSSIDIEIKGSIDSDTIALSQIGEGTYIINESQELQPLSERTVNEASVNTENNTEIIETEIVPQDPVPSTSKISKTPSTRGLTRATALEKELQVRLQRNDLLKMHEDEIHALRLREYELHILQEEEKLKTEKMKYEEQVIRKRIAEEQLQQEILKTASLKQNKL